MTNNKSNPSKSKTMQDRVEYAQDSASDSTSTSKSSSSKSKSKSK